MIKKALGASQLQVAPISIGCWSFGGNAEDYWGSQDQADVDNLVAAAIDSGANFFDTAYGYNDGRSEISLGQALKGRREKAIVCTKTPIQPSAEAFEQGLADSLKRLRMDYVDLLMIHWPTRERKLLETNLLALNAVRKKGMIRYAGVSNFALGTMNIARELEVPIVANEFAYSLLSRAPEAEVVPYCIENDIGITTYMSLMQGILTGKYASLADIPPRRRRTVQFDGAANPFVGKAHATPPADAEALAVVDKLRELAPETGLSVGQLALAWCVNKPGITTAFVGCRNAQQLRDNILAGEAKLAPSTMAALDAASKPVWDKMGNTTDIFGHDRIW